MNRFIVFVLLNSVCYVWLLNSAAVVVKLCCVCRFLYYAYLIMPYSRAFWSASVAVHLLCLFCISIALQERRNISLPLHQLEELRA